MVGRRANRVDTQAKSAHDVDDELLHSSNAPRAPCGPSAEAQKGWFAGPPVSNLHSRPRLRLAATLVNRLGVVRVQQTKKNTAPVNKPAEQAIGQKAYDRIQSQHDGPHAELLRGRKD